MQNIPAFVFVLFALVVIFAVFQFYLASGKSVRVLAFLVGCAIVQSVLGIAGFYQVQAVPPRFVFLMIPGLLMALILCISRPGRDLLDQLDIKILTLLHIVRLPVEIVLYYIFIAGLIPDLMTFEGRNFDILSGISAGMVYYFVFVKKWAGRRLLLIWNVICLFLLINILSIAILSAQTPFQQLAFDQPNIGVTYFPFVLLPALVVPIVLISHLAAIRQLLFRK